MDTGTMQNDDDKPHMGRPPLPEDKRAGSFIQLRVKRERKAAYVRAAQRRAKKPKTLAAWCFEHLDKASGYTEPTQ